MSGPLRSKHGCWTCRLRKKKCDEVRPHCATCQSLAITCYGFGPKPDWMDNGDKEKAVANSLKETVKHTSRRKAPSSSQRDPVIRIAPKSSNTSVDDDSSVRSAARSQDSAVTSPSEHESSQQAGLSTLPITLTEPSSPGRPPPLAASIFSISADEPALLMHFLDNIFPLQYPMYKPRVAGEGRGWLLSFLLRAEPFYHAALALTVYHRRTTMLADLGDSLRVAALVQQERHMEVCLKLISHSAQHSCPKTGLAIEAAAVQLMFFELFAGDGKGWQAQLLASLNMRRQAYEGNLTNLGRIEKPRPIPHEDLSTSKSEPLTADEVVTYRFLTGTIIWLDITFSVGAGTSPHLLPYHSAVTASDYQTRLDDIMGCNNEVMLQIGRIAALHEAKTKATQHGYLNCAEFNQTVCVIRRELACGLAQGSLEVLHISEGGSANVLDSLPDPPTLVTTIFNYMASVYLHLVVHGFRHLEVVETTVSTATILLRTQVPRHVLPALVLPLFVIGAVTRPGDEQFFQNMFSSPPLLDPSLKHRQRILPILREIWSKRQTALDLEWQDCIALCHDVLLI